MTQNYALIIGVRDYDNFATEPVPGARNDARAWVRWCLSIGFSPQNIRVLASPQLSAAELGPGTEGVALGVADHDSITSGLTWISEQLGGDATASGLVTFSGHGEEGEDGCPLVCPSDLSPSLDNAIDIAALRDKASRNVKDNLTVMLDCCHAQVQVGASKSIRDKLRSMKRATLGTRGRLRVVAACMRDQESVSSPFAGETMGAFTWAVTSSLGQWKPEVENDVVFLGVSYGNLLTRVRVLLGALSFDQVPVVSGPDGVRGEAFLRPGKVQPSDRTVLQPTAERSGRQLDVGNYEMLDAKNNLIAYIVVTDALENWYFNSTNVQYLSSTSSLSLKRMTMAPDFTQVPSACNNLWTTATLATWGSGASVNYQAGFQNFRWNAPNRNWITSGTSYFVLSLKLTDDKQAVENIDFFSEAQTQFSPTVTYPPYAFYRDNHAGPNAAYVDHATLIASGS